jgi:hypothetical protein
MIFIALTGQLPYRIIPITIFGLLMVLSDFGYYILLCLIWVIVFIIFWAICGFLLYRFVDRKLRRCPDCNRGSSGMITDTDIEHLDVEIDHSGKQAMKIKSEKVTDHLECKHCGHTWIRSYVRKDRIPIEKGNTYQ